MMDDLKARLLHGEGQDWDLPYATRKEAHDYIERLEAQISDAREELARRDARMGLFRGSGVRLN